MAGAPAAARGAAQGPRSSAADVATGSSAAAPTPPPPVVRTLRGSRGEYGAAGVVEIEADAARVYDFMRQVEAQPSWHSQVKHSQIVSRINSTTTLVKQVLRWSFLALRGDFHLQLRQTEAPALRTITTELVQGTMMRRFSSRVGVKPLPQRPGACVLEMDLLMQPTVPVPFGVRHMVSGQVRRQLHGVLVKVQHTLHSSDAQQRRSQQPQQQQPQWWAALAGAGSSCADAKRAPAGPCLGWLGGGASSASSRSGSSASSSGSAASSAAAPLLSAVQHALQKGVLHVQPLAVVW